MLTATPLAIALRDTFFLTRISNIQIVVDDVDSVAGLLLIGVPTAAWRFQWIEKA